MRKAWSKTPHLHKSHRRWLTCPHTQAVSKCYAKNDDCSNSNPSLNVGWSFRRTTRGRISASQHFRKSEEKCENHLLKKREPKEQDGRAEEPSF